MLLVDTGSALMLMLAQIDHSAAVAYRRHGLSSALAVEVLAVIAVQIDQDKAAQLMRHLARSAVSGDLPIRPVTPTDQAVWMVATTTVAALMNNPIER
jgi:hypothetical protein